MPSLMTETPPEGKKKKKQRLKKSSRSSRIDSSITGVQSSDLPTVSFQNEISKMMFVSGDSRESNLESVKLMEFFVRKHIIDIIYSLHALAQEWSLNNVKKESQLCIQKSVVKLDLNHLLFLFRNDQKKVNRIVKSLNWKKYRRSGVNSSSTTTTTAAAVASGGVGGGVGGVIGSENGSGGSGFDQTNKSEFIDNVSNLLGKRKRTNSSSHQVKYKVIDRYHAIKSIVDFSDNEEFEESKHNGNSMTIDNDGSDNDGRGDNDDYTNLENTKSNHNESGMDMMEKITTEFQKIENKSKEISKGDRRLKAGDEITKKMTVEEYMDYSKCREASFTYPNTKKFKEWLNTGRLLKSDGIQIDDDILESLGFIAWEAVGLITQASLVVRKDMCLLPVRDEREENFGIAIGVISCPEDRLSLSCVNEQHKLEPSSNTSASILKSTIPKKALEPLHIMEAVRRINQKSFHFYNFTGDRSCWKPQKIKI